MFINFFLMFSGYRPIDLLHGMIFTTITCNPEQPNVNVIFYNCIF